MRSEYRCLASVAAGALGSILLASSLAAQGAPAAHGPQHRRRVHAQRDRARTCGRTRAGCGACSSAWARAAWRGTRRRAGGRRRTGPAAFRVEPDARGATKLVKVRDDVYRVNVNDAVLPDIPLFGGNVGIYLTDGGVVLVDSKNERMHDDLVAKVRSLTNAPISYVVLTHNHADHSAGAAQLRALGATVVMSAADRKRTWAASTTRASRRSVTRRTRISCSGVSASSSSSFAATRAATRSCICPTRAS